MHISTLAAIILSVVLLAHARRDMVDDDSRISEINNRRAGWRAGHNPRFSNVSLEDAAKLLGLTETPVDTRSAAFADRLVSADTLPTEFDARQKWSQCVMPIRDQQSCGGCWAFAASSMFGMRQCIQTTGNVKIDMAPQFPISCDTNNNGCNGGSISGVWSFFQSSGHVADTDYPYTSGRGSSGSCSLKSGAKKYYSSSYKRLNSVAEMQQEIYNNGPIQVGFDVYQDFYNYKSGVYSRTSNTKSGAHSVYFVGWGEDGYGVPYWIAVNSWSAQWGMNGVFYIKRGTNECNIETGYRPYAGTIRVDSSYPTTAPTTTTTTTTTTRAPTTTTRAPTTTTTTRAPVTSTSAPTTTTRAPTTSTSAPTTSTSAPTTSTTGSPSTYPIPTDCWTCAPGWAHWYDLGLTAPSNGDRCQCIRTTATTTTRAPTTTTRKPTTTTRAPSTYPIPTDCWTCAPGWRHWFALGWSKPSNGDRCQCVRV